MIPSSPIDPFSFYDPSVDPMKIEPVEPINEIDDKAQVLVDKWLKGINAELAQQSNSVAHEYYMETKDNSSASEVFMKLVEDLYSEAEMLESSDVVADETVQDSLEVDWSNERFAWETAHFRELLDNVVEARKETYSHDFRAFVERVARAVDLRIEDLMPNDSEDIVYIHEAWKKLNDVRSLKDIVQLDLSNLDLHALPPEVAEMDNLEELILSNNKLLTLPKEIGQLLHLRRLLVAYNVLKSLPRELGDLEGLIELDLSNNRLEKIPESFSQLTNLQTLDLSVNRLTAVPHQVNGLKNLHNLVVFGNHFT